MAIRSFINTNMPAILSPNPKRISVFIRGGQIYEGRIEEAMGSAHHLGGVGSPKRMGTPPTGNKEDSKI